MKKQCVKINECVFLSLPLTLVLFPSLPLTHSLSLVLFLSLPLTHSLSLTLSLVLFLSLSLSLSLSPGQTPLLTPIPSSNCPSLPSVPAQASGAGGKIVTAAIYPPTSVTLATGVVSVATVLPSVVYTVSSPSSLSPHAQTPC